MAPCATDDFPGSPLNPIVVRDILVSQKWVLAKLLPLDRAQQLLQQMLTL